MPAGRPPKYNNPEEMQVIIDKYFNDCFINRNKKSQDDNLSTRDIHPTVTGLALALDLTRQSLINYEVKEEFLDTVKKAKLRVESYIEQRLYHNNATGCIFNLKNNFGWKDKQELDVDASVTATFQDRFDPDECA